MSEMQDELIAPCGMNCRLCLAFQREKKHCNGCRPGALSRSCRKCKIKNCSGMSESALGFCYNCSDYPCRRLTQLDTRYRAKYHMSEIENLEYIKEHGMEEFLRHEEERWTCRKCGSIVCIHKEVCPTCQESYSAIAEETYPSK